MDETVAVKDEDDPIAEPVEAPTGETEPTGEAEPTGEPEPEERQPQEGSAAQEEDDVMTVDSSEHYPDDWAPPDADMRRGDVGRTCRCRGAPGRPDLACWHRGLSRPEVGWGRGWAGFVAPPPGQARGWPLVPEGDQAEAPLAEADKPGAQPSEGSPAGLQAPPAEEDEPSQAPGAEPKASPLHPPGFLAGSPKPAVSEAGALKATAAKSEASSGQPSKRLRGKQTPSP
jgi:hypothetical protein